MLWKVRYMAETKEILSLTVEISDAMLRNGAEVYRVEDTATRILKSQDVEDSDVYVLANGIFASAHEDKEDACSIIRHVPLASPHLGRVAALNQLAREICSHQCSVSEAWERLDACKSIPIYGKLSRTIFSGLGCGGFTYLFGGAPLDMLFSFFIGMLLELFSDYLTKQKSSRFIASALCSAFVTFWALMLVVFKLPVLYDKIIIGDIMPLVPGIALTTSIRDFFNGDYLCGTIHLIDALLTSFCIAVGVGTMISIFRIVGGVFIG